jgi:multiple sugar transport system ATP-binding protein
MDEPLSNLDAKLRVQMRSEIARLQRRLGTTTVYVTHDQTEAMTLGDRVVVMHGGIAQQIGTPDELYERPANLFVAGFVGSPAMNFFAGTLTPTGARLPFGEVPLTAEVREAISRHPEPHGNDVVIGVRPEHLGDAGLLDDAGRGRAVTFGARVDLVESLGADKYLYFTPNESSDTPTEAELVARVPAASKAAGGQPIELALDPDNVVVFDAKSGVNLSVAPAGR